MRSPRRSRSFPLPTAQPLRGRRGRHAPRLRLLAFFAAAAGLASACGDSGAPGDAGGTEGAPGAARQAAQLATKCVNIQRGIGVAPVADADLLGGTGRNQSFGAFIALGTGNNAGGLPVASLLRFELGSIPAGAIVDSSTLVLYDGISTGPLPVRVHRAAAPWDEATVTFASFAQQFSPDVEASFSSVVGTIDADLTALTQKWVNGVYPNYGVLLEEDFAGATRFYSSENSWTWRRPELSVCYTACAPGFGNCDGDAANGCEAPLGTLANCGACGNACSAANGTPACTAGACAIACDPGFADCDHLVADGCEAGLGTVANCGACGHACAFANATASCTAGACGLLACNPGFGDCNGNPADGCETALDAAGDCCGDLVKDHGETGVDCGGGVCPPCADGQGCAGPADCTGQICANGVCQTATCVDGVQNGAETGVDCGGPACPACGDGRGCNANADCQSQICLGGACQVAGFCTVTCGFGLCQVTAKGCVGNQPPACTPGAPQVEQCNGVDDDCDGQVDDGCACENGQTQPCYGGAAATLNVGLCHGGTQTCALGRWGACASEVDPVAEACNGKDDDCNGQVDDGNPGGGNACGTGLLGVCAAGTTACTGGKIVCNENVQPSPEVCDGLDQDCNGQVDDGAAAACPPPANAVAACTGGACVIGACTGAFLDCDGNPANGCEVDGSSDAAHCGGCANACPAGGGCTGGSCVVALSTTITSVTPVQAVTNFTTITFTFTASVPGGTFVCSLDGAAPGACTSPASYANLLFGAHTFTVRAALGQSVDPVGASYAWEIEAIPVAVAIYPSSSTTGVTIFWETNKPTTTAFSYGPGTNTNLTVPEDAVYSVGHSVTVKGLLPAAPYSFRVGGHSRGGLALNESRRVFRPTQCATCGSCANGVQDAGEAGVDCGGPCSPCATCSDNLADQGENNVDCGGPCAPCDGCSNGLQDPGETGVDCGGACAPCLSYSERFFQGAQAGSQCDQWIYFRRLLTGTSVSITIRGDRDATGVTCTGAAASTLCQALNTGTDTGPIACNGRTWRVSLGADALGHQIPGCGPGQTGGGQVELSADGDTCACGTGYVVRPCTGDANWGGVNGVTCGAPSQVMTVLCQ